MIAPVVVFNDRPGGRLPCETLHVKGAIPPVIEQDALYAVPTVAPGSDVDVKASCPSIAIAKDVLPVFGGEAESEASTVKFDVPLVLGVPAIAPVLEFRLRPAGRLPLATDQE